MRKLGLSLSGGGVRGAAHIGVLKSLKKHGIHVDMISGTSAASIVAALFASGYSANEMESIFLEYQDNKFKRIQLLDVDIWHCIGLFYHLLHKSCPKLNGFLKGNALERKVRHLCEKKGITKLRQAKIPIAIPAVDLRTSDITMFVSRKSGLANKQYLVYYNNIDICEVVRASSSLPIVFAPKYIGDMQLVDGGIRQNLPSEVLRDMGAEVVIGVDVGFYGQDMEDICGLTQIASRTLDIMTYQMAVQSAELVDIMIYPNVFDVRILNFSKMQYCIDCGEKETDKNIEKIIRLIDKK